MGLGEFYERYIDRFWQRTGLTAVSGDSGFLDMETLPLGYANFDINDRLLESARRQFDKFAERYA